MPIKINNSIKPYILINMNKNNNDLSAFACKDSECIRIRTQKNDIRTNYFRDIDKIIYSLAYMRYIDKTQVFSQNDNDMISKRIIHVQLVSKIARTIGRALNLNEDLIEAATLGHDLGHTPFGHVGESILNEISLRYNEGYFNHNVQSVRLLTEIENNGFGSNVSIQVLDAILCHNGEMLNSKYEPIQKSIDDFFNEYQESYSNPEVLKKIRPMTLEGCVVRISDLIAYIGKDIEDAIRIGVINHKDIPETIKNVLGETNSDIVDTIINDVINNSFDKNYIKLSSKIYSAFTELMEFNYKYIYNMANTKEQLTEYKMMFNKLCDFYLEQLKKENKNCDIYKVYLNYMNFSYNKKTSDERKVLDFVSGMTDDYFLSQYKKYFN